MRIIDLNFHQRIALWQRMGAVRVESLGEAAPYLRVIDRLRPTDEERSGARFGINAQGQYEWALPHSAYGIKAVELEDEEAEAVVTALKKAQPYYVHEVEWVQPLVDRLSAVAVAPV